MKPNIRVMKLITKLIILMMLFVMLFLISAFMYSARYWPDIYHYINSNVTVKRIPTLSELNLTMLEFDNSTESYSTTDAYAGTTEDDFFDFDIDEFTETSDAEFEKKDAKREIKISDTNKDYSLLPDKSVVDYFFVYDEVTTTVMDDLIDEGKLTTRDMPDVEVVTEVYNKEKRMKRMVDDKLSRNISVAVFPWISAIYIKTDNNSQYNYFCDGALLSENIIVTAARCVNIHNETLDPKNILVILGKRSLQEIGVDERAVKVKSIIIHENFTYDPEMPENDLAILVLEEQAKTGVSVQAARLPTDQEFDVADHAITTAWNVSGRLTVIFFEKMKIGACDGDSKVENLFCATYGQDVTVCPSYGGLFVTQLNDKWYLHGVLTGDTVEREVCVDKKVNYTLLKSYMNWLSDNINVNKVDNV